MSTVDLFWQEDPLPVMRLNRDPRRCEQCWREAYGSFPGHVFCREHFMEFQARAIAQVAERRKQGAA